MHTNNHPQEQGYGAVATTTATAPAAPPSRAPRGTHAAAALGALLLAGGCAVLVFPAAPAPALRLAASPHTYAYAPPTSFNNSHLIDRFGPPGASAGGFDPCRFIVETTDAVWNTRDNVSAALRGYFVEDYIVASTSGTVARGMAELEMLVAGAMSAFPDIRIQILDCFCVGDEESGFKCSMPDILTGTNLGASKWGPATGRKVAYRGNVNSILAKTGDGPYDGWQYVEEFAVHDEWSLATQLGALDVAAPAERAPPSVDEPIMQLAGVASTDLGVVGEVVPATAGEPPAPTPPADVAATYAAGAYATEPAAKATVRAIDMVISSHKDAFDYPKWHLDMLPFWREDVVYDSMPYGVFDSLHGWFDGEHLEFNRQFTDVVFTQMLFLGDASHATTTTYAVASWIGAVKGVAPAAPDGTDGAPRVSFRITDFYKVDAERKITYNFMMWDVVDLLRQAGRAVLPPAPLPDEGFVRPPAVMDGVPAPLSAHVRPADAARARGLALRALREDWEEQRPGGSAAWRDDATWYGPAGFGVARGLAAYRAGALAPAHAALRDVTAEVEIVTCEGTFCGVLGTLAFTQVGEWLGEPAPAGGRAGRLRFGFHYRAEGDALVEGYAMFDLPGLFAQWGIDLYARAGGSAGAP